MHGDLPRTPPERRGGLISQANHPPLSGGVRGRSYFWYGKSYQVILLTITLFPFSCMSCPKSTITVEDYNVMSP